MLPVVHVCTIMILIIAIVVRIPQECGPKHFRGRFPWRILASSSLGVPGSIGLSSDCSACRYIRCERPSCLHPRVAGSTSAMICNNVSEAVRNAQHESPGPAGMPFCPNGSVLTCFVQLEPAAESQECQLEHGRCIKTTDAGRDICGQRTTFAVHVTCA